MPCIQQGCLGTMELACSLHPAYSLMPPPLCPSTLGQVCTKNSAEMLLQTGNSEPAWLISQLMH